MAAKLCVPTAAAIASQRQPRWIFTIIFVSVVLLLFAKLHLQLHPLQWSHRDSCNLCCTGSNRTVITLQYTAAEQYHPQQQKRAQNNSSHIQHTQKQHVGPATFDAVASEQYCAAEFPWIEAVAQQWLKPAYASAKVSDQNTSTALQAIKDVRWGDYHPGMEEVRLAYNTNTQVSLTICTGVDMTVTRVSEPNQPWKPRGMLAVLKRAVHTHSAALGEALRDIPSKEVRLIIETEDFPLVYKSANWKLPAFAMCASPNHIDIPVPDFTFEEYPEAGYANSSWPAVSELLRRKGEMVPWKLKHESLFMRQNKGVGYRKTLMPVLEKLQQEGQDTETLGVPLDIADTGLMVSHSQHFVMLDSWCNHRYQLHTSGFSYSASLKYKMACGSVVINFMSPDWQEFYYPALSDGVQYLTYNETDEAGLKENVFPKMKESMDGLHRSGDSEPALAQNARSWVKHNLSNAALSCYWYRVLLPYIKLYAAKHPSDIPELV